MQTRQRFVGAGDDSGDRDAHGPGQVTDMERGGDVRRPETRGRRLSVLIGYDGSPSAVHAMETAALLVPEADATVVYFRHPPFASGELRQRLTFQAHSADERIVLFEREGRAEAERLVGHGVTLVRAAGWDAQPLVERCFSGDGYQLARLAEQHDVDAVVVGSRGLSGLQAVLGSTSDLVVHVSPVPVLVVPFPLTTSERDAVGSGPVLVAFDGSPGAERAAATSAALFPDRELLRVTVEDPHEPGATSTEHLDTHRIPLRRRSGRARSIADALNKYAAERAAAVLVVGSRGQSGGRELLLGSVAKAVLHHAHRPVLVVPAAGAARP